MKTLWKCEWFDHAAWSWMQAHVVASDAKEARAALYGLEDLNRGIYTHIGTRPYGKEDSFRAESVGLFLDPTEIDNPSLMPSEKEEEASPVS